MTQLAGDRYIVDLVRRPRRRRDRRATATTSSRGTTSEFDEWAESFVNPFADLRADVGVPQLGQHGAGSGSSRTTASSPRCCSPTPSRPSSRRATCCCGPRRADEYELRWAGLRAHNRWMADFCADTPGRRAGMAQVFLNDVDDAVAEIEWAAEQRPVRWHPAARRTSGLGAAAPVSRRTTTRSGRPVPGPRHADEQPQRRRGSRPGARRRVDGRVHGRAGVVLAPACSGTWSSVGPSPSTRGSGSSSPSSPADGFRARSRCSTTSIPLPRPEHRRVALRRRARGAGHREAQPLLGAQLLCRRELLPAVRDAAAPRHRRRPHHVGPGLPAHRGRPIRTRPRRCATASPASATDEVARMVGLNAVGAYGFDLDVLAPVAEKVGPTVEEVDVPLERDPRRFPVDRLRRRERQTLVTVSR